MAMQYHFVNSFCQWIDILHGCVSLSVCLIRWNWTIDPSLTDWYSFIFSWNVSNIFTSFFTLYLSMKKDGRVDQSPDLLEQLTCQPLWYNDILYRFLLSCEFLVDILGTLHLHFGEHDKWSYSMDIKKHEKVHLQL